MPIIFAVSVRESVRPREAVTGFRSARGIFIWRNTMEGKNRECIVCGQEAPLTGIIFFNGAANSIALCADCMGSATMQEILEKANEQARAYWNEFPGV